MYAYTPLNDHTFGPKAEGLFDFTLKFENIFMSIVPAILVILAMPLSIAHMKEKTQIIRHSNLLWTKLVSLMSCIFSESY